jgi:hypothetical protein
MVIRTILRWSQLDRGGRTSSPSPGGSCGRRSRPSRAFRTPERGHEPGPRLDEPRNHAPSSFEPSARLSEAAQKSRPRSSAASLTPRRRGRIQRVARGPSRITGTRPSRAQYARVDGFTVRSAAACLTSRSSSSEPSHVTFSDRPVLTLERARAAGHPEAISSSPLSCTSTRRAIMSPSRRSRARRRRRAGSTL